MTPRTIHIGGSFAIVFMAYWAYALLAVPWIEPPPAAGDRSAGDRPLPPASSQVNDLGVLFPSDSWQLRDAKIIHSNQARLLWQKYQNHGNGWVELTPLTIVFMPDEDENSTVSLERLRHAIVMDVPDGANLHFDRPLDLNKGSIGRLIEGRLRGPVTIHSQGKRPDHQDDLLVLTRDVDLSEQRITTAADVDFRWNLNSGRGRQMEIKLLPRLGPGGGSGEGPNVGGIEQFQIEHVERLHLETGTAAAPGGAPQPAPGLMPGPLSAHGGPIEITCRGPFRFNLVEQVATFRDRVDVQRIQPNGPADHLGCELLSVFFIRAAPKSGGAALAKPSAPGFDLQPARVEAQGTPTTLEAPLDHVRARAEQLQYNLLNGQIYLQDSQEVVLRRDADEIHSPSLRYTPGPPNHTGQFQLLAAGPGWLRAQMADRPGQQLEARWRQKLKAGPQDGNEVISLLGGALLDFQAMGRLEARDIHFWLHELPQDATGRAGYQPDRLLAEGTVVGTSPQFACRVQRLETWFTSPPPAIAGVAAGGPPGAYVPSTFAGQSLAAAGRAAPPAGPPSLSLGPQNQSAAGGRQAHMEISGRLLRARVLMRDQQHGDLTEVTVIDGVKLEETQTAQPGDLPLVVTGQWLHATEAESPRAKVDVKGEPAHMEGRGMSLTGPIIHIDRGANLLTMEGPGRMEKKLDRDLENRPLGQPGTIKIDWQKGMTFDGRKAHFQDSVNVIGTSQLLQTGWLDVGFQQPISFSSTGPQQSPQIESLRCGGGVLVENRSLEGGQPASYERMQLKNLELNNISGDFHGDGPGWLVSVRHGSAQEFTLPGGPLAAPSRAAPARAVAFAPQQPPSSNPSQLICIHLRFMNSITGNKLRKTCVFHGQVRTAYAPVSSWTSTLESDDPNRLGPQSVVLHCDSLEVTDMTPMSSGSAQNVEGLALGNVKVEGVNFTGRGARGSFTQAKDMVILEGDGRSDAEIFKQDGGEGTAASRFAAQKIHYFLKTKQVVVDGVRSLDMNQIPSTSPSRR